jgi:hypothetical protein
VRVGLEEEGSRQEMVESGPLTRNSKGWLNHNHHL